MNTSAGILLCCRLCVYVCVHRFFVVVIYIKTCVCVSIYPMPITKSVFFFFLFKIQFFYVWIHVCNSGITFQSNKMKSNCRFYIIPPLKFTSKLKSHISTMGFKWWSEVVLLVKCFTCFSGSTSHLMGVHGAGVVMVMLPKDLLLKANSESSNKSGLFAQMISDQ